MSRMIKIAVVAALVAMSGLFMAMMGCEELSQVSFTVDQETEEFEVDLDAQLAVAVAAGKLQGWDQLPDGECMKADAKTLQEFFFPLPTDVDLEKSPQGDQVKKYKGKITAVDIDQLTFTVTANSLSFDVPFVELYIGDVGAAIADLVKVVNTPELKKGELKTFDLEITKEVISELAARLEKDMKFSYSYNVVGTDIDLCKGGTLGKVKGKAIVKVTVFADAL